MCGVYGKVPQKYSNEGLTTKSVFLIKNLSRFLQSTLIKYKIAQGSPTFCTLRLPEGMKYSILWCILQIYILIFKATMILFLLYFKSSLNAKEYQNIFILQFSNY